MTAKSWEFEEALECFRVIETCLRCIYEGESHMYRVLSTQLRILFCDSESPLLKRLFPNFSLPALQKLQWYRMGDLPKEFNHLDIHILSDEELAICLMPIEIRRFYNGVEDGSVKVDPEGVKIFLKEWIDQVILIDPVPVTIKKLIKTFADRGGGAHVHKSKDALLGRLKSADGHVFKLSDGILALIALGKVAQEIGFSVIQLHEQGARSLPLIKFDKKHPSILDAAKVPDEYLMRPYQVKSLLAIAPAKDFCN